MQFTCFGFASFELRYNLLLLINGIYRKALRSLQNVGGLYGLVVPCEEVQFPGQVVGYFTGGEPLRAILHFRKCWCKRKVNYLAIVVKRVMFLVRDMACS